ncbi:hypothetical protein [Marinifilum caeruleilacunae]|uniref:HNH endonuclease n=1 Tax=Marinifilum caeruleilacunae TaxID=2499076 RepID=A0ABX1WWJ3_9BACT|nr:hypothetical protein [Marinifilum caeruleilacunae]NOU60366.1 hypothetical protein [Marinifilum caeruleilacunae]
MSEALEITHSAPIPKVFYMEKEEKQFTECTICGKNLTGGNELYLIEKAFEKKTGSTQAELVFELACCMDCRQEMHDSLSIESNEKIAAYFEANSRVEERDRELKEHNLVDTDIWLNNCIVKNKSMDEVNEYQIYALCWKDELVFHQMPFMLCGETIDDILNLLSSKSLDIINDLTADLIDLPPEFGELFKDKKVLFI